MIKSEKVIFYRIIADQSSSVVIFWKSKIIASLAIFLELGDTKEKC